MFATNSSSYRSFLLDLLGLTAVLFVFYTLWLGSYPLFTPDEGRYSEIAREMVATGDYITPKVDGVAFLDKPVLYYWLQATAIQLFGVKEWALRFFPMLTGIFGCLYVYICGRLLFDRRTGLLAAIILGTTPLYFGAAHYANMDLEVATWISSTLFSFLVAVQNPSKIRKCFLGAAYFFAALAFLTKGLIGVAFPAMIAGIWIICLWRWNLLKKIHLFLGLLFFAALVLPWYVLAQQANPEFLHFFFVTQQVTRFLSAAQFNNPTPGWFYLPVVAVGFFPWTIFLIQTLSQKIRAIWINRYAQQNELFLLIWLTVIFVFFSIPHSKIVGYILPVFPPLALLTASYLANTWEQASGRAILLAISILVGCNALFATGFVLAPRLDLFDFPQGFTLHAYIIATIFIISACAALFTFKQKKWLALFCVCALSNVLFLLTLTSGAAALNRNTAKPLTTTLLAILKPEDEVVNYFKLYQDVPLYLGRRITIVANWSAPDIQYKDNWVRELWYGMAFQKTDEWLIDEKTFWQRWNSKKRLFVFVNDNYFEQFKKHTKHYYIVAEHNDIILLSNMPST